MFLADCVYVGKAAIFSFRDDIGVFSSSHTNSAGIVGIFLHLKFMMEMSGTRVKPGFIGHFFEIATLNSDITGCRRIG